MKFLDNFSVIPLEKISSSDVKFDFFICCSSFEERCYRSVNILKLNKIRIEKSLVFKYLESDPDNKRDRNLNKLQRNLGKISGNITLFDKCSVNKPSEGMKAFKQFLIEESVDLHNKLVVLDITVFTKPYLFILIKLLKEEFELDKIFIIYTEPEVYGKRNNNEYTLTDGLYHINHIPGFHGHPINTNDALIVLLGFEGNRALDIYYNVNPDVTYALNGFPAFQPGWQMKSIEMNKRFLSESGANLHLFNAPANDPFETMRILEKIIEDLNTNWPNLDVVIAPLGTKVQALGTLLCALKNQKIRIVYPYPSQYSTNYSEGYGISWIFKVSL